MHRHKHACIHDVMKFCRSCQRPYCEDCGEEWYAECRRNHDFWNRPILWSQPYYSTLTAAGKLEDLQGQLRSGACTVDVTPAITCAHGKD